MPRGDYQTKYRGKGMPPSRNTLYVEQTVSEEEFTKNWKKAFGKTTSRPELTKPDCTCNLREIHNHLGHFIVQQECARCGSHYKMTRLKTTQKVPGHSNRQKKKVKEYVIYGRGDRRVVTDRN